jgi:hypothetical protein
MNEGDERPEEPMADSTPLVASLDEILLSIADGIHQAQRELNQLEVEAAPGGQVTTYYLPKVDFEIRMTVEMTTAATPSRPVKRLLIRPIRAEDASGQTHAELVSTVRGSFVAVPANGGRPGPVLGAKLRLVTPRELAVDVSAATAVGEPMQGERVELNVDRDASRRPDASAISPQTDFVTAIVQTDAAGLASGTLRIDQAEPRGTRIAIVIDVAGRTQTYLHEVT